MVRRGWVSLIMLGIVFLILGCGQEKEREEEVTSVSEPGEVQKVEEVGETISEDVLPPDIQELFIKKEKELEEEKERAASLIPQAQANLTLLKRILEDPRMENILKGDQTLTISGVIWISKRGIRYSHPFKEIEKITPRTDPKHIIAIAELDEDTIFSAIRKALQPPNQQVLTKQLLQQQTSLESRLEDPNYLEFCRLSAALGGWTTIEFPEEVAETLPEVNVNVTCWSDDQIVELPEILECWLGLALNQNFIQVDEKGQLTTTPAGEMLLGKARRRYILYFVDQDMTSKDILLNIQLENHRGLYQYLLAGAAIAYIEKIRLEKL